MIPRHANPHVIFKNTQIISREALDKNKIENGLSQSPDSCLVDEYNELMKHILPQFEVAERPKKWRKAEDLAGPEEGKQNESGLRDEPILFRLVSTGSPELISLKPEQVVHIKAREPEAEDTKSQAKERRKRALAVAVDADWVVKESVKPCHHPSTQSPVLHLTLSSPLTSASSVVIICHNKPLRKTRPPVKDRLEYPYDALATPKPLEIPARGVPVIDLNRTLNYVTSKEKPKKRRRRKVKKIEHTFWRPDPNVKSKCMGYAMGYTRRWT